MKKVVNLLLTAVITFLCVVSAGAQGDIPKDTSEQWMRIIAMAPGGKSIVEEASTRAEKLRREIAAKRVEDKSRVLAFLNTVYLDELVTHIDDYFGGGPEGIPQNDFLSEPKGIKRFLGHEFIVESQRNSYDSQESLNRAINTTLDFQILAA
jgi:hypothetical protein